jgi:hypothetical protein
MNRRTFVKTLPALTVLVSSSATSALDSSRPNQELRPITLPKPETDGGKSVLAALKDRKTTRNISAKELPQQVLSNLLWAAFGVNREKGSYGKPGRTAASASNSQEIDLYVALSQGVYLYEPARHQLAPVVAGDFRSRAGRGADASAPVNIFYVVDLSRYDTGPGQPDRRIGEPEVQKSYYYSTLTPALLPATSTYLPPRRAWLLGSTTATEKPPPRTSSYVPTNACSSLSPSLTLRKTGRFRAVAVTTTTT